MKPALFASTLAVLLLPSLTQAQQSLQLQQASPPTNSLVPSVPFLSPSAGLDLAPSGPSEKEVLPLIPALPESAQALDSASPFGQPNGGQQAPVREVTNRTEDAVRQLKQRIRYREIKARTMALPEVREPLDASRKARSDRELRGLLQKHYERLFDRMAAAAPDLAPLIRQQQSLALEPLSEVISAGKP
ncbi:MAG: hypothetical protein RLZZ399_70 [Verrucomicrobiota bacterium]